MSSPILEWPECAARPIPCAFSGRIGRTQSTSWCGQVQYRHGGQQKLEHYGTTIGTNWIIVDTASNSRTTNSNANTIARTQTASHSWKNYRWRTAVQRQLGSSESVHPRSLRIIGSKSFRTPVKPFSSSGRTKARRTKSKNVFVRRPFTENAYCTRSLSQWEFWQASLGDRSELNPGTAR
jgi:hypothetical protein